MTWSYPHSTIAKWQEEEKTIYLFIFFWGSFIERRRRELNLPPETDPYSYYDLDWVVTLPNMDPWIRPFETLQETPDEVVVKTGFWAIVCKRFSLPMPEMCFWEIDAFFGNTLFFYVRRTL